MNLLGLAESTRTDLVRIFGNTRPALESHPVDKEHESLSINIIAWPPSQAGLAKPSDPNADQSWIEEVQTAAWWLGIPATLTRLNHDASILDAIASIITTSDGNQENPRCLITRSPASGTAHRVAHLSEVQQRGLTVINGGDLHNEDPIEALIHLFQFWKYCASDARRRVLVVGDLYRNAIARSIFFGLVRLGADIHLLRLPGLTPVKFPSDIPLTLHNEISTTKPEVVYSIPISKATLNEESRTSAVELTRILNWDILRRTTDGLSLVVQLEPSEFDIEEAQFPTSDPRLASLATRAQRIATKVSIIQDCLTLPN